MSSKARRGRGEGAIFQRSNGLWVARIELPSPVGGRRRKEITATTKERLLEKLKEPRRQFYMNGDLPSAGKPVSVWMEYWLDNIAAKRVRPNTLTGYRAVARHINDAIGNIRLEKLSPAHVRRVHDHVSSIHSSTYALLAHRVLARALKDAEHDGLINRNPALLTDAPRKARPELHALTLDQAIEIIGWCVPNFDLPPEQYDPALTRWATYLLTGMRRGELLGLEWDRVGDVIDLSWQLQRLPDMSSIPHDYEHRHMRSTLYLTRPKSGAGWRVIPLVDPLAAILKLHRERTPDNPYGLVFTHNGLPIDPDTETAWWKATAAHVTNERVRLHDLRHTTVDLLLDAGVHEDVVAEIVGHSDRAMTRGYKSRTNITRRTEAMRALSSLLGGP